MNHFLPTRQVKLHLSKSLAKRLAGLDDETYGRFMSAKQFAEAGLSSFYTNTSIGLHPVPIFDGILLLIKFHTKSELFYIDDFVDWGEDPPPQPGHFIHWARRNGLSEILINLGFPAEFALTISESYSTRGSEELLSTGANRGSVLGMGSKLLELLSNNDGRGSSRAIIWQAGAMPDLASSHRRAAIRPASWGEAMPERLPALSGDDTFSS